MRDELNQARKDDNKTKRALIEEDHQNHRMVDAKKLEEKVREVNSTKLELDKAKSELKTTKLELDMTKSELTTARTALAMNQMELVNITAAQAEAETARETSVEQTVRLLDVQKQVVRKNADLLELHAKTTAAFIQHADSIAQMQKDLAKKDQQILEKD